MPTIKLTTHINAPIDECFDLSRNIDAHKSSMQQSNEEAIAGVTSGLIEQGQTVTWRATHFLIPMHMTVQIVEMQRSDFFIDQMIKGPFKKMWHKHSFKEYNGQTIMTDEFIFEAPLGILSKLVERLLLTNYMTKLLEKRNQFLKHTVEANA